MLFLLILMLLLLSVAEGASVWFLYDDHNEHHRNYVQASAKRLHDAIPTLEVKHIGLHEGGATADKPTAETLLVSVGTSAARQAVAIELPTLNTLITRRKFELLSGQYRSPVTAIYFDQPVRRYLQLIKSAMPGRNSLTVLMGSESRGLAPELMEHSRQLGLGLQLVDVGEVSSIETLFAQRMPVENALLLLPDPQTVNRRTVKPLVLGSYRYGVPLVGYSQALVKAGALMAVHSTLPDLEAQLVLAVEDYFYRHRLPAPRYAEGFEVTVNYQLARALKLSLPTENKLKRAVQEYLR